TRRWRSYTRFPYTTLFRSLLSTEEEVELARRLENGYLAAKKLGSGIASLSTEEIEQLRVYVNEGLAARDHLIKANTRLVVSIARSEEHTSELQSRENLVCR